MILSNRFDHPDAVRAREAQSDPLVQYLVVRREYVRSLEELLAAAARATVLADRQFRLDPAWAERIAAWHASSFRKVTLRANERDWPKLLTTHTAIVEPVSNPMVAVLPPRFRGESDKLLRGLQAYVTDPAELPRRQLQINAGPVLALIANPALRMSAGKLVAQVGHAALMAADAVHEHGGGERWAHSLAAWGQAGYPVLPLSCTPAGWDQALQRLDGVVVTDSGLTEIAPGSQTVLAIRPLPLAELPQLRRLLTA